MGPVAPEVGQVRFAPLKTVWLWAMLVPGLVLAPRALTPLNFTVSMVLAGLTLCLGHSVALHRTIIHRALKQHPAARTVMLGLFTLTGLGGAISWVRLHYVRDYWQNQAECPPYFAYRHSLLRDFWWNLHLRFVPRDEERYRVPNELLEDPQLQWIERWWLPVNLAFLALLYLLGGTALVLTAGCARIAAGIIGHWFIGYVTHKWGERRYGIDGATETGTNVPLLGWVSFGEGFHNNHHAFPDSAQMGLGRFEFDLGWCAVRALEHTGLAFAVKAAGRGTAALKTTAHRR